MPSRAARSSISRGLFIPEGAGPGQGLAPVCFVVFPSGVGCLWAASDSAVGVKDRPEADRVAAGRSLTRAASSEAGWPAADGGRSLEGLRGGVGGGRSGVCRGPALIGGRWGQAPGGLSGSSLRRGKGRASSGATRAAGGVNQVGDLAERGSEQFTTRTRPRRG